MATNRSELTTSVFVFSPTFKRLLEIHIQQKPPECTVLQHGQGTITTLGMKNGYDMVLTLKRVCISCPG